MLVKAQIDNDTTRTFPRTLLESRQCDAEEAVALKAYKVGKWRKFLRAAWLFAAAVGAYAVMASDAKAEVEAIIERPAGPEVKVHSITLKDGTKCAVAESNRGVSITCNWRKDAKDNKSNTKETWEVTIEVSSYCRREPDRFADNDIDYEGETEMECLVYDREGEEVSDLSLGDRFELERVVSRSMNG